MDQDHLQPPQPQQPEEPEQPQYPPPQATQYPPPQPTGSPSPQPPPTQQPSETEQFRGYVIGRLKAGTPKRDVLADLVNRGIDHGRAAQLVNSVDAVHVPEEEDVRGGSIVMGALGAALAAVVGGLVWGLVAGKVGFEIGFLATGIGVLCGGAVVLASGGKRGSSLQVIAVIGSTLGIFIGKYFTFYFILREMVAEELGPEAVGQFSLLSLGTIRSFFANIGLMGSGFEVIWIILAMVAAWRIPRAGISLEAD
jgi:hypothetical protein